MSSEEVDDNIDSDIGYSNAEIGKHAHHDNCEFIIRFNFENCRNTEEFGLQKVYMDKAYPNFSGTRRTVRPL